MFSKFYYKRRLKSYKTSRSVDRQFLNIKKLKHMVIAMECNNFSELREVKKEIKPILEVLPMVSYVVFLDIKRVEDLSVAVGAYDLLLFKDDVERKLTPSKDAVERFDALNADVFVNLNRNKSDVIDFLSEISQAKMRVAFEEKEDLTELMLTVPAENGYKAFFEKLIHFMGQINAKTA